MEAFSVEELARTSDDTVVRRRFDRRNRMWFVLLLLFFVLVCMIEIGTSTERDAVEKQPYIAVANAAIVAVLLLVMLDTRRLHRPPKRFSYTAVTRLVRDHVTAVMIGWAIVQNILVISFVHDRDAWMAWAIVFPFLFIAVRLIPAEAFLMHGVFFAVAVVRALLSGMPLPHLVGAISATAVTNLGILGIVLVLSRRMRKELVDDWTLRRSQAREQLRMRDELQFARELQTSMLPDATPRVDWLDISAVSLPASEVGGDYYDYFEAGEGRLAIVSSDVAGHGLASGLVLSAFRGGFVLLRDALGDPGYVLTRLDDLVAHTSRKRMLVTAAILLLDRDKHHAAVASAGHPPILFRHGDSVRAIEAFAPPLGTRLQWNVPRRELTIEAGDVFVLHTDGLYETLNVHGEAYGLDRLMQTMRDHEMTSAESLRDAIVRDVETFRGSVEQADDITVVVVRVS
ncbi:MAG TPA: PP2C family protein-serine/threonine phosphatase, partial [Thermoanaerobaculia bacterium]|nr:PP2C family protein-serine/threonine phosphatase [Thermoanaerobaculia bacterium]